jgi:curved DNA-binding protein CbpA
MEARSFVNHYDILEVNPSASAEAIEYNFRNLARRYHPDNQDTGDRSKFDAVVEAHDVLKDIIKRAHYHQSNPHRLPPFSPAIEEEVDSCDPNSRGENDNREGEFFDALDIDRDLSVQSNILIMLYLRRRKNIKEPGMGDAELERLSGCPHEHLEFHLWYLKSKGWVSTGEDGRLAITIDGVDRAALIYQENARKLITDRS